MTSVLLMFCVCLFCFVECVPFFRSLLFTQLSECTWMTVSLLLVFTKGICFYHSFVLCCKFKYIYMIGCFVVVVFFISFAYTRVRWKVCTWGLPFFCLSRVVREWCIVDKYLGLCAMRFCFWLGIVGWMSAKHEWDCIANRTKNRIYICSVIYTYRYKYI